MSFSMLEPDRIDDDEPDLRERCQACLVLASEPCEDWCRCARCRHVAEGECLAYTEVLQLLEANASAATKQDLRGVVLGIALRRRAAERKARG
jgi:hypothetical protein